MKGQSRLPLRPCASVSRPALHQAWSTNLALRVPTAKKATPVITALQTNGRPTSIPAAAWTTKISSGTAPKATKRDERHRGGSCRRALDRGVAELLGEHGPDPDIAVAGERLDDRLQRLPLETLGGVDLPNLLPFALRVLPDLPLLLTEGALSLLSLRPRPEQVADRHREAVGDQVRRPEDDHDAILETRPGDAGHHGEGGDDAVDRAVDEVAEVAPRMREPEAAVDGRRGVFAWRARDLASVRTGVAARSHAITLGRRRRSQHPWAVRRPLGAENTEARAGGGSILGEGPTGSGVEEMISDGPVPKPRDMLGR